MKIRYAAASALFFFILGLILTAWILKPEYPFQMDPVAVNRLTKQAELHWDSLEDADFSMIDEPFSILDSVGTLLYRSGADSPVSVSEAVRQGAFILDISKKQHVLGKLLLSTNYSARLRTREKQLAGVAFFLFTFLGLLVGGYFLYLRRRIFLPFQQLQGFASRVASGNLEAPLQMDRRNLFGAFTESFDLMREELRQARHREMLVQQEKKELVASLSHDIKTPVTAIKLQCELMEVTAPPAILPKLQIIHSKAERIDSLITNLFQTTLEELGELAVEPVEVASQELEQMLKAGDSCHCLEPYQIPGCILSIDPLRMEQVLDNLLYNSYKYAGTPIRAEFVLTDEFLKADFYDYGRGVGEEEIPFLFQKFYRGHNASASGKDGSGLGLYLCRYFMEQMGGDIRCGNWENGFHVELLIRLA